MLLLLLLLFGGGERGVCGGGGAVGGGGGGGGFGGGSWAKVGFLEGRSAHFRFFVDWPEAVFLPAKWSRAQVAYSPGPEGVSVRCLRVFAGGDGQEDPFELVSFI